MTVKSLIARLRQLPQDLPVVAESYDQYCVKATMASVVDGCDGQVVVIRTAEHGATDPIKNLYGQGLDRPPR